MLKYNAFSLKSFSKLYWKNPILPLNIVIHIHQIADAFHIVRNIRVAADGMLNHAACHRKVDHIHRSVIMHHRINQSARKGVAAADTVENIKGKEFALECMVLIPQECFQAVLRTAVRIADVARNAFDIRIPFHKGVEDFILLFVT